MNYNMFHGGTNFGNTAGRFVPTSYDYDASLDEYGLQREPKYTHLKYLHRAIKMSERALISSGPKVSSLGSKQEAHVFRSNTGACAAFLANYDTAWSVKFTFGGSQYNLHAWSISILPDCKKEVYNTAKVIATRIHPKMTPVMSFSWQSYVDETPSAETDGTFSSRGLYEQLNLTRDTTDYLWYMTDVHIAANERFLRTGNNHVLIVMSAGHALHVYVNGQLAGNAYGSLENPKLTFSNQVKLIASVNKIALLSDAVGLAMSDNLIYDLGELC